jgi:hypothetical protein
MDKIAIKLPDNITPTDPSPILTRIQGRDRRCVSPGVGERQGRIVQDRRWN